MLAKLALGAFFAVLAVIVYGTVIPLAMRLNSGRLHPERMLAFLALGGTMTVAFPGRLRGPLIAIVLIACGLEFLQTFIPHRDGRLPDAIEKSVGGVLGVLLGAAFNRAANRFTRGRS